MARPHIEPYVELDSPFKKFDLSGFKGSHYKVLSMDPDTGACTLKVRFDGGFKRKPGLSYSDLEIFVLNGTIKVGRETWGEGHYSFIPAGMSMDAVTVPKGAEALLMFNDAEPNFVESDRNHQLALTAAHKSFNSYVDAPWAPGNLVTPSVASGCLIKVLHYDVQTEAISFLYMMSPEFMQNNISYHDCAEESYHIWGTSWMLQFGQLPTGGYFWRPPYISHGSFRSKLGCIAFGRTDSKLHNYFHFNPWSNPDENLHRAAAFTYRQRPQLYDWIASDGHNHPHGPPDFEHQHYHDDAQVRLLHGHGPAAEKPAPRSKKKTTRRR